MRMGFWAGLCMVVASAWTIAGPAFAGPVITTVQPQFEPLDHRDQEGGTVLLLLDAFDTLGLTDRPSSPGFNLSGDIAAAITYAAEGDRSALGRLATNDMSAAENCEYFTDLRDAARIYDNQNNQEVLIEGVKAGVLTLDEAAGPAMWSSDDGSPMLFFGLHRQQALERIAAHPDVSLWLRQAALGILKLETQLDGETRLIRELEWRCGETGRDFRFHGSLDGETCDPDDPDFARRVVLIPSEVFNYLEMIETRNLDISCAVVEIDGSLGGSGTITFENVLFSRFAASGATADDLTLRSSYAPHFLDLGHARIGGDLRLEDVKVDGRLITYDLQSDAVTITDSEFAEMDLRHAAVDRVLDVSGTSFGQEGIPADDSVLELYGTSVGRIAFQQLNVFGSTDGRFLTTSGEVFITGSTFGESDDTLWFDGAIIKQELRLINSTVNGSLSLVRADMDRVELNDVDVKKGLHLTYAHVAAGLTLADVSVDGWASFEELRSVGEVVVRDSIVAGTMYFARSSLGGLTLNGSSAGARLDARDAVIEGEMLLYGSTSIAGQLSLSGTSFGRLIVENATFGSITIADATFRSVRASSFAVNGDVNLRSVKGTLISLESAIIDGSLYAPNMTLETLFIVSGASIDGDVAMSRLASRGVVLSGVEADSVMMDGALIENGIEFSRLSTETLSMNRASARQININADVQVAGVAESAATCAWSSAPADPADSRQLQTTVEKADALDMSGESCVGHISVSGATVDGNFGVGGTILDGVDLTSSGVEGQLALASPVTNYAGNSCITARNVRADTIIYDLPAAGRGPFAVDVYGASFRMISSSEPQPFTRSNTDTAKAYVGAFTRNMTACNVDVPSPGSRGYQPAIYDALAAGQERAGDLDLARRIRFLKNEAYAETLGEQRFNLATLDRAIWAEASSNFLTRLVYWLAGNISGYGYDNLRAVIILILITIAGIGLGWAGEARIARVLDPVFGRWTKPRAASTSSTYLPPNRRYASAVSGRPRRPNPFFALDRSVPSLALDSAFGSHEGLGPYLSFWFYFQRIVSFLILLLMVAGAFNVFQ